MTHAISEQLIVVLFMVVGMLITPLLFIALDFWAGIRKAKARKDKIRSDKMQRTIAKMSRYYNAILAMLVLDVVQIAGFVFLHVFNGWTLYTFPLFTLVSVIFVAAIEIKSILEPADAKESRELKEVSELAKAIVEHKQDPKEIAAAIASYLNSNKGIKIDES
ncbi:MAG: phage holin family protein [Prevotella sp.]|nr:phage holin family protein [Prevotella sp.]